MSSIKIPKEYFDKLYPTYIEIPEDYWVCSDNVEYSCKENATN